MNTELSIGHICQDFLVSLWKVEGPLIHSFEGFCLFYVHARNLNTTLSFSLQYKLFMQYKGDVSRQSF